MTNIKVALDASIINEKAGSLSLYITPDSSSIEVIRRLLTKWSLTSKTPEEFQLWMISDTNGILYILILSLMILLSPTIGKRYAFL